MPSTHHSTNKTSQQTPTQHPEQTKQPSVDTTQQQKTPDHHRIVQTGGACASSAAARAWAGGPRGGGSPQWAGSRAPPPPRAAAPRRPPAAACAPRGPPTPAPPGLRPRRPARLPLSSDATGARRSARASRSVDTFLSGFNARQVVCFAFAFVLREGCSSFVSAAGPFVLGEGCVTQPGVSVLVFFKVLFSGDRAISAQIFIFIIMQISGRVHSLCRLGNFSIKERN